MQPQSNAPSKFKITNRKIINIHEHASNTYNEMKMHQTRINNAHQNKFMESAIN
jgi:hypothetical protein